MKTRKKTSAKTAESAPQNVLETGSVPPPAPRAAGPFASLPKGWKPASEALDRVRAIQTIFPDFNRATRVGGLPLRRIITVHGPTHGGKTAFVGGLLRSFVDADHVGAYCDAEHATDLTFFDELMGRPVDAIPNLLGMRPESYEETIDAVDTFLASMVTARKERMAQAREELKLKKDAPVVLPPHLDLAGCLVLDSINKLVPEREIERLKKEGGDAIDKGWGRLRAAFNQAFLDHVVPLLGKAETSLVVMVQERDDEDLDPWEMPKLKGGKATQYDASLIVRVMKAKEIAHGEGKDKRIFGFKHRLRIWKSKVGHMDGRWTDATFHMSNGTLAPPGFDTARDALEVAKELGIVEGDSWLSWRKKRWQGINKAVQSLSGDPESLHALMAQVNAAIRKELET
jgi:RecA/RadA recombinase